MELTIDKSQVYDDVAMNVSIVGRNLNDANGNSLYDKVRIQDRDMDILSLFWSDAFGMLLEKLGNFITSSTDGKIVLADDRRMNEAALSNLKTVITDYMVYSMTADWMKLKAVEYAGIYTTKSESLLASVLDIVHLKKEPNFKKINNQ